MKKFNITVNGTAYEVEVEEVKAGGSAPVARPAAPVAAAPAPAPAAAPAPAPAAPAAAAGAGETAVEAPMPGKVIKVVAAAGTAVKSGDVVIILEAMKMQNEICAPCDGTVKAVNVSAGQTVTAGQAMAIIG
ncbi:MAG: biotin/lipoyl-binding protein [Selenomonadaceae bacterium]|nr:biotin/lipoyl-binding protein [Selenomonadaceae bacterium]